MPFLTLYKRGKRKKRKRVGIVGRGTSKEWNESRKERRRRKLPPPKSLLEFKEPWSFQSRGIQRDQEGKGKHFGGKDLEKFTVKETASRRQR